MQSIKRYNPNHCVSISHDDVLMSESAHGCYVHYSDYQTTANALQTAQARNRELENAIATLVINQQRGQQNDETTAH